MQFALDNDVPIIAEEPFFKNPSYYEKKGVYPFRSFHNDYDEVYEFDRPTDERLKQLKKYVLPLAEKKRILSKYPNFMEGIKALLSRRDKDFETWIDKQVVQIEKEHGKIEAILTWSWYPSLEAVCKKRKITLIQQELASFRPNTYALKMGYFQFYDKYNSEQLERDYEAYQKEAKPFPCFSREELLALFLAKDNLFYLHHLNDQPQYEFGVSIGPDTDPYVEAKCLCSHDDLLGQIERLVPKNRISLRIHPDRKKRDYYEENYLVNHSSSSLEWILKNKRIASIGSNLSFEAELLGKTAYIIGKNFPYRSGGVSHLDFLEEKVCDAAYLNYIIFGYYVPYSLMFDRHYIAFRLRQPSNKEIYAYHLKYLLQKSHLTMKIFKVQGRERLCEILKQAHGMTSDEANAFLDEYVYLEDVIRELTHQVNLREAKYQEVVNSRSWKVTKPLRNLKKWKQKF